MKTQPNLNRLTRKRKVGNRGRLSTAQDRTTLGASKSTSFAPAGADTETGTGIASPLTESPGSRTYHDAQTIYSSDGFLALEWSPAHELTCTDANDEDVVIVLADP